MSNRFLCRGFPSDLQTYLCLARYRHKARNPTSAYMCLISPDEREAAAGIGRNTTAHRLQIVMGGWSRSWVHIREFGLVRRRSPNDAVNIVLREVKLDGLVASQSGSMDAGINSQTQYPKKTSQRNNSNWMAQNPMADTTTQ